MSWSRKPNSISGYSATRCRAPRNLHPVRGHALRVLACVRVPRLDRVRQRTHSGHVRAPELLRAGAFLLERLAQIGGVALELALLVGRLLLAPAPAPLRSARSPRSARVSLPNRHLSIRRDYPSRCAHPRAAPRAARRPPARPGPPPSRACRSPAGRRVTPSENRITARRSRRPRRSSA